MDTEALAQYNSDRSPLYDVRKHARRNSGESRACGWCFSRTMCLGHSASRRPKRGGARRDRTDDLMLAKHALSQLSYGPAPEAQKSESQKSEARTQTFWLLISGF